MPTVRALDAASSADAAAASAAATPSALRVASSSTRVASSSFEGASTAGKDTAATSSTTEKVSGPEVISSSTSSPSIVPVKWNVYLPGCDGTKSARYSPGSPKTSSPPSKKNHGSMSMGSEVSSP